MRNFHIILIKKQIPTNMATIAIKMGILLITVFSTHQIHQIIIIRKKRQIKVINRKITIKIDEHL